MKNYLLLSAAFAILVTSAVMHGQASAAQAVAAGQPSRGSVSSAAAAGLAILNRSCTSCHDAAQVKQARPAADWPPIIEQMRNNGANISDSDAKVLLDYLTKNYSSHS